jgi:hypothetical protein
MGDECIERMVFKMTASKHSRGGMMAKRHHLGALRVLFNTFMRASAISNSTHSALLGIFDDHFSALPLQSNTRR